MAEISSIHRGCFPVGFTELENSREQTRLFCASVFHAVAIFRAFTFNTKFREFSYSKRQLSIPVHLSGFRGLQEY